MFRKICKKILERVFLMESPLRLALASSIGIFIGMLAFDGAPVSILSIFSAFVFRLNVISVFLGVALTVTFPLVQQFANWVGQKIDQINMPLVSALQMNIENVLKLFQFQASAILISIIFYIVFSFFYNSAFSKSGQIFDAVSYVFQDNTNKRRNIFKMYSVITASLLLIIFVAFEASLSIDPVLKGIGFDKAITATNIKPAAQKASSGSTAADSNTNSLFKIDSSVTSSNEVGQINNTNVFAFYVSWDNNSKASLKDNIKKINVVMPDWFHFDANMNVKCDNQSEIDALIKENGVKNMPLISNYINGKWDRQFVHDLISSQEKRSKHVEELLSAVKAGKYYGVNIDYENIDPQDKDAFTSFIKELSEKFHENGYYVSLDLDPTLNGTFSYKELSNYADYLMLMFYDENYATGAPGPIASQEWFETRLAGLKDIPKSKIIMGLGSYGYDWILNSTEPAESVTFSDAINTAGEGGLKVEWDSEKLNPHYTYKEGSQNHVVWFLDGITFYNELKYSVSMGMPNVGLWRLGSEDPVIWNYIDKGKNIGNYADALKTVSGILSVDYEGLGEILHVDSIYKDGVRNIESNNDGFVLNESYISFPSRYDISRYGKAAGKKVALTFDDGPNNEYTTEILDILKKYNVKADFFVVGKNAAMNADIIKRMYAEGHEIGNHTFSHPNILNLSDGELKKELNATQRVIQEDTGHSTLLFRFPLGMDIENLTSAEIEPILKVQDQGYTTVDDLIDPKDWKGISSEEICRGIENQLSNGNIILLHDAGGDRSETVEALPKIIESLRSKGYEFVTVSSLLGKTRDDIMPLADTSDGPLNVYNNVAITMSASFVKFSSAFFLITICLAIFRLLFLVYYSKKQHKSRKKHEIDKGFTPFVSVVIAAYNEEKVICMTIDSILESNYRNFEIVLVNDGSNDDTSNLVKEKYRTNQMVKVVDKENGGKASSLNLGFRVSSGEIIIALDADTIIDPDAIPLLVSHFKDEKVAAVSGNVKVGNIHNMITKWQHIEYVVGFNLERRAFSMLNCVTVVPGALGAWRKDIVARYGYFKEDTLAEDTDMTLNILKNGYKDMSSGYKIKFEEKAYAYTESPADIRSLLKQRYRWSYGTLQCLWKHREMLFNGRYGSLGNIAIPNMWLFQYVFQPLSPIADMFFIAGLLGNNALKVTLVYMVFLVFDYSTSIYAFRLENEKMNVLVHLFLQRIVYRLIMTYVVIKSILSAIRGVQVRWNKLERSGSVEK